MKPETLPKDVEAQLTKLFEEGAPDVEELGSLLEVVASATGRHFLVIDALDECAKADRDAVLAVLRRLSNTSNNTFKIFLTSGESIRTEIGENFTSYHHMTMKSPEVNADIKTYVEDVIGEKIEKGDLKIGTLALIADVCDALVEGAQGMLVFYQAC